MGDMRINGNKFRRFITGGVYFSHATAWKRGKLDIRDNDFDGDPYMWADNRDYINGTTGGVTISTTDPAVFTWPNHSLRPNTAVRFTTNGTLPTGISSSGTAGARSYYVRGGATFLASSFTVAAYPNGPALTATSGAGSGTHTSFASVPDGTWAAGDSTPYVIQISDWDGASITGNRVRNVNVGILSNGSTRIFTAKDNVLFMHPNTTATLAVPLHADNRGIRDPSNLLLNGRWVFEDSNPLASTYGQTINRAPTGMALTIPTSGFFLAGEVVGNATYSASTQTTGFSSAAQYVHTGWNRITTGSTHTLNTDWREMRNLTGQ
jgi:hypothetical protein